MTNDWCNDVGLNLNPAKTVIVPFTRRYKLQRLRHIRLSGSIGAVSNKVKYLGVTFDSKLNFGPHVKNAITKCSRPFCGIGKHTIRESLRDKAMGKNILRL